jgi:MFS family permease
MKIQYIIVITIIFNHNLSTMFTLCTQKESNSKISTVLLIKNVSNSGGVTTMVPFLKKFFPDILKKAAATEKNMYCVYDNQMLTLFTSSLYLAALVSSLAASKVTAIKGRRNTIMLGGAIFLIGAAINGGSENIAMLIIGRVLLGFGVGFTSQVS